MTEAIAEENLDDYVPRERAPFIPQIEDGKIIVKVKSTTNVTNLGRTIAGCVLEYHPKLAIHVRALGAGAINQALKAIVKAKAELSQRGITIYVNPFFVDFATDRNDRGEISLAVFEIVVVETHHRMFCEITQ